MSDLQVYSVSKHILPKSASSLVNMVFVDTESDENSTVTNRHVMIQVF